MATNVTLNEVGDRIYAINQTISGVKTRRYFPQNLADSALHPLLVAFPGTLLTPPGQGAEVRRKTRTWDLILIVGNWMSGLPTESAQATAESLIDVIETAYLSRPRLELDGNTPLTATLKCEIGDDSGLVAYGDELAIVRWPLLVTIRRIFTFELST